jgi:hypothetical protein
MMQDGEANDKVHALVRIQFNSLPSYDARQAFPKAAFIKELSFRSAKPETAHKFVQVCALDQRGPRLLHLACSLWLDAPQNDAQACHRPFQARQYQQRLRPLDIGTALPSE